MKYTTLIIIAINLITMTNKTNNFIINTITIDIIIVLNNASTSTHYNSKKSNRDSNPPVSLLFLGMHLIIEFRVENRVTVEVNVQTNMVSHVVSEQM